MSNQRNGASAGPVQDIRSQLSGLVLSNGTTVSASLQRNTPPSLASSHHRPLSPPVAQMSVSPPSVGTPSTLNFEQLKQLFANKPDAHNGAAAAAEKPASSPTGVDPITSLMQQLQSQQQQVASQSPAPEASKAHSKGTTPVLRPAAAPVSMVPPPKSEQERMAREAAKAHAQTQRQSAQTGKGKSESDVAPSQRRAVVPATAAAGGSSSTGKSSAAASGAGHSNEVAAAKAACAFISKAFGDKALIDNLDAAKPIIRTAPAVPRGGRYIVVGDIHGCVDQLEALLEKVKYVRGTDCLIMIGDYVSKGPDSIGVVRACIRHEALGVLGNYDFTLINCIARMRRRAFTPDELRDPVKRLAQEFPRDCECYLRALPHAIRIPTYNVLLVHAGVNIQNSLEHQDVRDIMHVRRLEEVETHTAAHHKQKVVKYNSIYKGDAGEPWAKLWKGPELIIFGHDAYVGFQSHPFACGIDTGCVYGDALTCVIFSPESPSGAYFDVPGLPKYSNERLGLPPPESDLYEQSDLERHIIRPTPATRATPVTVGTTPGTVARPNFLAIPPSGDTGKLSAVAAAFGSPASLNLFATPATVAERNATTRDSVSFGAREVQCASLLALATAGELAAIAVLLCIPSYDRSLEDLLETAAKDTTAQQSFWQPFVTQVLRAVEGRPAAAASLSQCETDTLDYVLGVCDELPAVGKNVKDYLCAVQKRSDIIALGTQKYVTALLSDM